MILRAQSSDGGWGPNPMAASEPFDTAVVLLALRDAKAVARGRAFLIARQRPDGGWPETTRPAGAQSYAQHISTTAWAALALLADAER
jgi:Prenyltransferase and squalene oxidase repeat.